MIMYHSKGFYEQRRAWIVSNNWFRLWLASILFEWDLCIYQYILVYSVLVNNIEPVFVAITDLDHG